MHATKNNHSSTNIIGIEYQSICQNLTQHSIKKKSFAWCSARIVLCFCFVFLRLVCPMLEISLYCPFFIALRYSLTFMECNINVRLTYLLYQLIDYIFNKVTALQRVQYKCLKDFTYIFRYIIF